MANRTTATEVKAILDNSQLTDAEVDIYITSANTLVTDTLGDSTLLGSTELKDIERWLAAHLISITRERIGVKEKIGDISIEYAGKFGEGLNSTPYGQMVLSLDITGRMAGLGKKKVYFKTITSFD